MAVLVLSKAHGLTLPEWVSAHFGFREDFEVALGKFSVKTRLEVEQYVRREAGGRAERVDLRAAVEAGFGERKVAEDRSEAVGILMATSEEEGEIHGQTTRMAKVAMVLVLVVLVVVSLMQFSV